MTQNKIGYCVYFRSNTTGALKIKYFPNKNLATATMYEGYYKVKTFECELPANWQETMISG